MVNFMRLKPDEMAYFCRCLQPLFNNMPILEMDKYMHHGSTSCLRHCLAVAYFSYVLSLRLKIKCNHAALIRGALLHDFFLYDWHKPDKSRRWHGFSHPKTALNNAQRHIMLNDTERDVIIKHMWPLTLRLPACREAFIVCLVDKICTIAETFDYGAGRRFYRRLPVLAADA